MIRIVDFKDQTDFRGTYMLLWFINLHRIFKDLSLIQGHPLGLLGLI
jgi:hypothetical protein